MRNYIRNLSVFNKTVLFSMLIVIIVGVGTASVSYYLQNVTTKQLLTQNALTTTKLWKETLSPNEVTQFVKAEDLPSSLARTGIEKQFERIYKASPEYLQGHLFTVEPYENHGFKIVVTANQKVRQQLTPSMIYYGEKEFYTHFMKAKTEKTEAVTDTYTDQFGTWITAFSPILNEKGEVIAMLVIDVDASVMTTYQQRLFSLLFIALVFLFTIIIFIQDRGLRVVMAPLKELVEGIKSVSHGNFQVKLQQKDASEIGQISQQFNVMTQRLQHLFQQVAATKEQLAVKQPSLESSGDLEKALDELEIIMERTKLQKELQRAEKMNAIGQLAASVAHEIRNPMTVVKGFLQLFQDNQKLTKAEIGYIHLMISEMDRAEVIINDYLSLARPGVKEVDIIDCILSVTSLVDLLSSYALLTSNIEIEIQTNQLAYVRGNKNEFNQVLLNIMKNGIEAMQDGGKLSVSINVKDNQVHIAIKDTGEGMTQQELDRLGTAFYSLKEKGTGIGLMVSYQIVEEMRGKITVESEKGKGSTFIVSIPAYKT
ncbi:two-component sensor histidine kinase [Bacillus sp. VT 712]|uniref:histidine kinase n=1 Tax=Priestia veravalensis TaxID=1414648 RepID=A0A0V8JPM2_9BACI|nr:MULTISPECIES: ATP-binding protein [Bacillaceae]KSU88994.1 histidine kinase [Priestia veravalensis]KZB91509.1 two-component sensor histidine kinase [Bacillus sp. VT 712]SCB98364.1 Signal transduction histidine kinase [Priestia flexa]